jgi:hypothetical protein
MSYSPLPSGFPAGGSSLQELAGLIRDFSKKTKKLREFSAQIGTKQDTKALRGQIQGERDGCNQLSKRITEVLRSKPPSRAEKANHEKLMKEFEGVFNEFQKINSTTLEKERLIVDVIHETLQGEESRRTMGNPPPEDPEKLRQTMMFKEIGAFDEIALQERQEEIRQLEKDMQEASSLFKDVAQMVNSQGEMLNQADEHVTVAVVETDKAVDELGKVRRN